jgi:hypothetical protein
MFASLHPVHTSGIITNGIEECDAWLDLREPVAAQKAGFGGTCSVQVHNHVSISDNDVTIAQVAADTGHPKELIPEIKFESCRQSCGNHFVTEQHHWVSACKRILVANAVA